MKGAGTVSQDTVGLFILQHATLAQAEQSSCTAMPCLSGSNVNFNKEKYGPPLRKQSTEGVLIKLGTFYNL